MNNSILLTPDKPQTPKRMKRFGIGVIGLGIACLGCCLAPLLSIFAATTIGASILAGISSKSVLVGLSVAAIFLSAYLVWKLRRKSCCSTSASNCKSNQCGIHFPKSDGEANGVAR